MKTIRTSRTPKMADNNRNDLNSLQFHSEEEWNLENIKVQEVEEIIKTEPEVVGGSWVHQNVNVKEALCNENRNLESFVEQLTENPVCQSCKTEYTDYCMNCAHLIHILNNEVEIGVYENAMDSIPKSILEIKGSLTDGYGVYALRNIPKGVKFGPYEGLETLHKRSKYFWKIRHAKLVQEKEHFCNWMRYIDCSTKSAQNLTAIQFMGKLYYKSLREIKIGEELLINYSNNSSDDFGLHRIQYFQPEVEKVNENIFKCRPCHFGFSEEQYLVAHNKVCPYKKKTVIEVNSSPGIRAVEDDSKTCERTNNLSTNCQKDNENGKMYNVSSGTEEKVLEQDFIENVKINKEEKKKLKFPDGDNTGALNKQIIVERAYKRNECSCTAVLRCPLLCHSGSHHATEKPYKCNDCSYATVTKNNLLSHIKHHHTNERAYKCTECSYAAVHKCHLLSHIKHRHTKEKAYKCNECSYTAIRKCQLLCHIRSRHATEKPYKCNECSYAAAAKQTLLYHIKFRHTMDRAYKCNECSYTAVLKCQLVSHIKFRHTMERPYKCNECSYAAVHKWHLQSHIKHRHTMEKEKL